MDDSPYAPSRSTLGNQTLPDGFAVEDRDRFGHFDLAATFRLAGRGLKVNLGPAIGLYGLMFLLLGASWVACCVGWVFALPHLIVGSGLMGYYMVRGDLKTDHIFSGFRRYGTVLLTTLILAAAYFLIYLAFGGPYHYRLLSFLAGADWGVDTGEFLERFAKEGSTAASGFYGVFTYLALAAAAYFTGRWLLAFPLIVERGFGSFESLAVSWRVTRPHQWQLFLIVALANLVAVSGVLLCGIGIFATYPIGMALFGGALVQLLGDEERGESSQDAANRTADESGSSTAALYSGENARPAQPPKPDVLPKPPPGAPPPGQNPYG